MDLLTRLDRALRWRIRARLGDARVDRCWVRLAVAYRPLVRRPIAVGVTGSGGKSTAKELVHGLLKTQGPGVANPGSLNMLHHIARVVLAMCPWHHHAVAELTEHEPGAMARNVALFRPTVALVTLRRDDHSASFDHPDQVLAEFACLVAALPAHGAAVLNADEPDIAALRVHTRAQVLTYGLSPAADVRAESVEGDWPQRLHLVLSYRGERLLAQTQLCGRHWVPVVLGAVATALACGMSLSQCVAALALQAPVPGRMQPHATPDGVQFIRDDYKAPLWTLPACVDFLRRAQAPRKLAVIGTLSDFGPGVGAAKRYAQWAEQLDAAVDLALYVGAWATAALSGRPGGAGRRLAFSSVLDVAEYLKAELRAGDLVLIKGTNKQDHLERLVLNRTARVDCWRDDCKLTRRCSECHQLTIRSRPPNHSEAPPCPVGRGLEPEHPWAAAPPSPTEWVVVGMGNPGSPFEGSPHNLGRAVVEALAQQQGWPWHRGAAAHVACGLLGGRRVSLLLPQAHMNLTGPLLQTLAREWGLAVSQMLLVHDDLSRPLGEVKQRASGSAGGHRGVDSVLVAFQTDRFRRLKLGARPEVMKLPLARYVVEPLEGALRVQAEAGLALAVTRLQQMIEHSSPEAGA
ncbi:aminoacyl-tRNA hydrolase [Inhella proteolytica]|uniref:Mur ligase central domain-containing protein n=1 Tax=Inhella proteolytica TaxID=2795029 RepID=A0A931J1H2_9BURK|nr:aminoacyl-tRNA hydrolase [Inhella proteolytica]MBH9575804.1 hypothetical protein [Inhella proteolytica]